MDSKVSSGAPGNVEQTKSSKKDIESKVARIFKLIKNYGQDSKGKVPEDSKKRTELLRLVEEVHRQYQSLYVQYDRLQGEVGDRARSRKGKSSSSSTLSPSSTSESEYYSSEEKEGEDMTNEDRKQTQGSASGEMKQRLDEPKWKQQAALVKVRDVHGSKASAQIKELEGQLTMMRIELESLRGVNKDLVAQVESKASECKKIGGANAQLENKILELELQEKYKRDEVSSMMKKVKDNEKSMMSQIKDLMDQVSHLHSEVEFLRDAKEKLELGQGNIDVSARMKGLEDRVFVMQQEMDTIFGQKIELEGQLEARVKEVCELRAKIEALRGETRRMNKYGEELQVELQSLRDGKRELEVLVEGRDQDAGKLREENEEIRSKLQSLDHQKQEVEKLVRRDVEKLREENKRLDLKKEELKIELLSVSNQKRRLEEQVRSKNDQVDQLQVEKERLVSYVTELERSLAARSEELAELQKKHDEVSDENSAAIVALRLEVKRLQQEIDSLVGEKMELVMQIEKMKLDFEEKKIEVESQVHDLNTKIADQQRILKEKEGTLKNEEEQRLVKHLSLEVPKPKPTGLRPSDAPRINQHTLERKVEELADKFQMKMENHIRLLYQRILVAEQIHSETKDSYKNIKDTIQQENEELNEKLAMFESGLQGFKDLFFEQGIKEDTTAANTTEGDDHHTNFLTRIGIILNGIQSARDWIAEKNNEIEELKHNAESLTRRLEASEENEKLIKDNLQKLEEQVQQESEHCNVDASMKLVARVDYLEHKLKEREEVLLCLVDEKREAIRQLSISIDYHHSRYVDLKLVVLKMAGRKKRAT